MARTLRQAQTGCFATKNWLAPAESKRQTLISGSVPPSTAARIAAVAPGTLSSLPATTSTEGPAPLNAAPRMPCSPASGSSRGSNGQKRRAIRLVNAVLHGDAQQVAPRLGKGQPQQRRGLNVGHHVGAGIAVGQHGARLAGRQRLGGQNHNGPPLGRRRDAGHMHSACPRRPQPQSRPASRPRRCPDGPPAPKPLPESAPSSNPAGQNAPPARWPPAVPPPTSRSPSPAESHCSSESPEESPAAHCSQQLFINLQNEIVLQPGKVLRGCGRSPQSKTPPPARPQSPDRSRGPRPRRQSPSRDWPKWPAAAAGAFQDSRSLASLIPALPFSAASTAAGVASTTRALRCRAGNLRLPARASPLLSAAFRDESRWCNRRP